MFPNEESKKRKSFIIRSINSMVGRLKGIERRFYGLFESEYVSDLDLDGKKIKIDGTNFVKTNKNIDLIGKTLKEEDVNPLIDWFSKSLRSLFDLNWKYFKNVDNNAPEDVNDVVLRLMLERIGINPETGKRRSGGWLDGLTETQSLIVDLKNEAYKAIWAGEDLDTLRRTVRRNIQGDGKTIGALQRHYNTITYDAFQQYDREVSRQMAQRLGLTHAIYQGGLIETSRPFCIERNNKVFTEAEIEKFGTPKDKYGGYSNKSIGAFKGKNDGYNPFVDLGGHNCRHTLDWISEELAKQIRSDL